MRMFGLTRGDRAGAFFVVGDGTAPRSPPRGIRNAKVLLVVVLPRGIRVGVNRSGWLEDATTTNAECDRHIIITARSL